MKLVPYINFEGTCEEALQFYSTILNGKVTIIQRYDVPEMKAPEAYKEKILHASLQFGGNEILACDIFSGQKLKKQSGDMALAVLLSDDPEKGRAVFDALADGGKVHHPYEKQFWGDWHGNLTDKYGIRWMVNCELK